MAEIPIENPRKYGVWDDDIDELVDGLAGRKSEREYDPRNGFGVSHTEIVDEDFLRDAGNPRNHYGS